MVKKNKTLTQVSNFGQTFYMVSNTSRRGSALKKVGNIVGHSVDNL